MTPADVGMAVSAVVFLLIGAFAAYVAVRGR